MKTHIDSLEAGEILANIVKIIVKHSKTNNGKEFSLTGSRINYIAEELLSLIKAQSKRYADERVRDFIFFVYESGEVRTGVWPMDNLSHLGERFINQNTESEEGVE